MEAQQLHKELEDLAAQLWGQVQNNEHFSHLNQEQGEQLLALEPEAEIWNQKAED
jgi:hypothetical protein